MVLFLPQFVLFFLIFFFLLVSEMRAIEEHVLQVYPYLQALQILPVSNQDGLEPLHELVALYSAPPCSEDTPLPDLRRALAQSRPAQLAAATQERAGEEEEAQEEAEEEASPESLPRGRKRKRVRRS